MSKLKIQQSNQLTKLPTASRKWWTLLGIGIGKFMFALDIHIVNLALPT